MAGKAEFYKGIKMELAFEALELDPAQVKILQEAFNIVIDKGFKFLGDGPIGAAAGLKAFEDAEALRSRFSKK